MLVKFIRQFWPYRLIAVPYLWALSYSSRQSRFLSLYLCPAMFESYIVVYIFSFRYFPLLPIVHTTSSETITLFIASYLLISMFIRITDSSLSVLYLAFFFFLKKKRLVCVYMSKLIWELTESCYWDWTPMIQN